MMTLNILAVTVSIVALVGSTQAQTVDRPPPQSDPAPDQLVPAAPEATEDAAQQDTDIVVTGIRQSLDRAAEIKQNAVQVVDSIVAQDIGKLPDPTTAAALQRVPGIQVSVNRNNELGGVRVRGLPDVLTTVNGREIFTTTGRGFDLQDLPAEALARVDVFKSQTPDLIEGGLAGVIDLKLNKPFNFNKPTVVLTARGNYGKQVDKLDPQVGALLTDRWETGIGDIGVLVNGTWSQSHYLRDNTVLLGVRSAATSPLNTPGIVIPNIFQTFPEEGKLRRSQVNAAVQWAPSDDIEVYLDGLYTRFRDRGARYGANTQSFTSNVTLSNLVVSDNCYDARVLANGQNPTIQTDAQGNRTMSPNTLQRLCYLESGRLNNPVVNLTTQARSIVQVNKQVGGGVKYDGDGTKVALDVSYQTSRSDTTNITVDIGRRLTYLDFRPNVDGIAQYQVDEAQLLDPEAIFIRNAVIQNFGLNEGDLLAGKFDVEHEVGGIVKSVGWGVRYARRSADSYSFNLNQAVPGGNIGTPSEAQAVLVSATGLPIDQFLRPGIPSRALNDGAAFLVPNPDYVLSDSGLDALRAYVGLPAGRPAFQQSRQFNVREDTFASYGQLLYEIPLGDTVQIDGALGARYVVTDRSLTAYAARTAGGVTTLVPDNRSTTDRDFLPTATARLKFDNGVQARLGYARSIRRPDFGSLNPVLTLSPSNNPQVQSGGSAGNPDLREQKSESYDATLEYYFRSGYVAIAGYYREIKDRVISSPAVETFDGIEYSISRPRNVGAATLKGVEVSGQYFLDFLPGAMSGFGLQGSFTLSDSEIGGDDPLAGNPLQGVSKYNFTSGLLYEKYGIFGRLVYTYRSRYFDSDQTGSISVRLAPEGATPTSPVFVPPLLAYTRPNGRLDFNIGYDINPAVRVDVGGTNILGTKTVTYIGQDFQAFEGFYDETTFSMGIRVRL